MSAIIFQFKAREPCSRSNLLDGPLRLEYAIQPEVEFSLIKIQSDANSSGGTGSELMDLLKSVVCGGVTEAPPFTNDTNLDVVATLGADDLPEVDALTEAKVCDGYFFIH